MTQCNICFFSSIRADIATYVNVIISIGLAERFGLMGVYFTYFFILGNVFQIFFSEIFQEEARNQYEISVRAM